MFYMSQSYIIYYVVKLSPSLNENFTVRAWGTLVWWFKTPNALVANSTFLWQCVCPRGQLSAQWEISPSKIISKRNMSPSLILLAENAGAIPDSTGCPSFKKTLGSGAAHSSCDLGLRMQGCSLNLVFAFSWLSLMVCSPNMRLMISTFRDLFVKIKWNGSLPKCPVHNYFYTTLFWRPHFEIKSVQQWDVTTYNINNGPSQLLDQDL